MKKEKCCGCVIFNGDNVLLIKQTNNYWGVPKGHMESGESEEETAVRETKEETNIDVEIISKKRYITNYVTDKNIFKEVVFFLTKPKSFELVKQESEIIDLKWVPLSTIYDYFTFDNQIKLFDEILEDLNK